MIDDPLMPTFKSAAMFVSTLAIVAGLATACGGSGSTTATTTTTKPVDYATATRELCDAYVAQSSKIQMPPTINGAYDAAGLASFGSNISLASNELVEGLEKLTAPPGKEDAFKKYITIRQNVADGWRQLAMKYKSMQSVPLATYTGDYRTFLNVYVANMASMGTLSKELGLTNCQ